MIDRIEICPDGGPHGLGFLEGRKSWPGGMVLFGPFYQDPVWPGSLGLEAFLQLLKAAALEYWPAAAADVFQTCRESRIAGAIADR